MCPLAVSQLADIRFDCSNEELFKSLEKIISGLPLPGNVIADVNPYDYAPSNLPDSIWYLIHSNDNANVEHGFWKIKGEATRLFSNLDIIGWRITREFFEGQAPNAGKTDWLMYEYWITRKGLGESGQDGRSLCRVVLGGELDRDQRNTAGSCNSSIACHQPKQSAGAEVHNSSGRCGTKRAEVNMDDDLGMFGRPLDHYIEYPPEIDYVSRGEYLELLDLSPSSSDNSSCLSMSSNECFDSLALLREMEAEELPSQEPLQKVDHCKSRVCASVKPDKVVILPEFPALSVSAEVRNLPSKEIIRTDSLLPGSTNSDGNKDVDNKVKRKSSVREEEVHRGDKGRPSNSNEVGPSSRNQNVSPDGRKRDARSSIKKRLKKKSCFMPFHLFL